MVKIIKVNKKSKIVECFTCKKHFKVSNARLKDNRGKYCSKKCYYGEKIIKICKQCGIIFYVSPSSNDRKSCSRKCKVFAQTLPPVRRACKICGKIFFIQRDYLKIGRGICCSKKCNNINVGLQLSGENGSNWKGGISFEPYGAEFNDRLREKIRRRDNFKCQICGCSESECLKLLSIHHIDYNKKNNKDENLASLCMTCHGNTGFNRNHWINYFKGKVTGGVNV